MKEKKITRQNFSQFVFDQRGGLSQFYFAAMIGVTPITISRWENNKSLPRDDAIQYWVERIRAL